MLILLYHQMSDIEYSHGVFSPIFVVNHFSGLFLHPSTILIKD